MGGDALNVGQFVEVIRRACKSMLQYQDELRELDAASGDGDLGITVRRGFSAVSTELELDKSGEATIASILRRVALTFNNAAASTCGVFFAVALLRASKAVEGEREVTAGTLSRVLEAAQKGIQERGKAALGDKTVLDALIPAAEQAAVFAEAGASVKATLCAASEAARTGAIATKGMKPGVGRASQLGDQGKGVQDPGATLLWRVLDSMAKCLP